MRSLRLRQAAWPLTGSVTQGKPLTFLSQLFHFLSDDHDLCLKNFPEEPDFFFNKKIFNSFIDNFRHEVLQKQYTEFLFPFI